MFSSLKKQSRQILIFALPLAVYGLLFVIPVPHQIGLAARYDFTVVLAIVSLVFLVAFSIPGKWGQTAGFLAVLLVFGLTLSGLWGGAKSEFGIVEGLLPWSDAQGYYSGALRLAEGFLFPPFSGRRPLFPGLLSSLLVITSHNLQIVQVILVAFNALACTLLAREIKRTHGVFAAVITLVISFVFYRRFSGTTLTENLGFALGAISVAVLWDAIGSKNIRRMIFGLFLLTVALIARAGTFLVLPVLAFWSAWFFRGKRALNYPVLALSALAIMAGFLVNSILLKTVVVPDGQAFSNFSTTFYGLTAGGKGWLQIDKDHPEVKSLPASEQANRIYQLGFEEIQKNPGNLIKGVFVTWRDFFRSDDLGAYGFLSGENRQVTMAVRLLLFLLALAGLVLACFRWRQGANTFIIAGFIGIFLSIPFLPPGDADHMRAYAATIPFFALLPAVGLVGLLRWVRILKQDNQHDSDNTNHAALVVGIVLVLLTVAGPLLIKYSAKKLPELSGTCPAGAAEVIVRVSPGSFVDVVPDDRKTRLPDIRWNDFIQSAHDHPYWVVTTELDTALPGTFLTYTIDLASGRDVWLLANNEMVPATPGILRVCGEWSQDKQARAYGFFHAQSVNKLAWQ
jgi:hypothetical protein